MWVKAVLVASLGRGAGVDAGVVMMERIWENKIKDRTINY
jgi:hypothetical protein